MDDAGALTATPQNALGDFDDVVVVEGGTACDANTELTLMDDAGALTATPQDALGEPVVQGACNANTELSAHESGKAALPSSEDRKREEHCQSMDTSGLPNLLRTTHDDDNDVDLAERENGKDAGRETP